MCLLAAASFLGLDHEILGERAGVLEFDGGLKRDDANKAALYEIMNFSGRYSRWFVNSFFNLAGPLLDAELAHGWDRARTVRELEARLEEEINARV